MNNVYLISLTLLFTSLFFSSCSSEGPSNQKREEQSGAGLSMDDWAFYRSYPGAKIPTDKFTRAFEAKKMAANARNSTQANWTPIGPKNFGGRTISLGFHPTNPDIIFAGSASGGLWKTTTGGKGVNAWEYIPTGFPVLGVGAIAIHPSNPDIIYIGTGELYNYDDTGIGYSVRTTRGSYGIGILKTEDGGNTWTKSLDWSLDEFTGVQYLVINPLNPNTVYAATSEGLFRSYNSGDTWNNIHPVKMAVDIEMSPIDTSVIFVTHGSFDPNGTAVSGVYRSEDAGANFIKLTNGIPASYKGKTLLSISQSNPKVIYASVADHFNSIGLFKSTNGGDDWQMVNNEDVAKYQGWYSHDVAVDPTNEDHLIYVGVDGFVSEDGGSTLEQRSYWYNWYFGQPPVGGPEGPDDYVHADIHRIYYHPLLQETVFMATDGGIFVTEDNGETFEGRNGGYQTHQFYANFSNAAEDSLLAIGGMQDNATAIYTGDDAWTRVIGGDGMCTALHPDNPDIILASYQNLSLLRSDNGGQSFFGIGVPYGGELVNFNGPFEIAPSKPNIVYAGAEKLYRSLNLGNLWAATSSTAPSPGNPILTIAVAPDDEQLIYVSTSPISSPPALVFKSSDAGQNWTQMQGLPDRICTDIAFDPENNQIAYATFTGFGTAHLFKTEDGGGYWFPQDNGLPDVPTNTVVVDPQQPQIIYVGNDLGVYYSVDYGDSWELYSTGLPDATLVMHLSISPSNRKLRAATHGSGVWESPLEELPFVNTEQANNKPNWNWEVFPNPVKNALNIQVEEAGSLPVTLQLVDANGRLARRWELATNILNRSLNVQDLPKGAYYLELSDKNGRRSTKMIIKE